MTADEAVALALAQPHVRQESASGVEAARGNVLAARARPNPQLELSQERGKRSSVAGGARETGVMLSQAFELGGRRGLRIDAAELGLKAARLAADDETARLRVDVLRTYAEVLAAERLKVAQAGTATSLEDLAAVADKRQRAGDLSGYESRRIVQASLQARAHAAQADAEAHAARARLAALSGDAALTAELDTGSLLPAIPVLEDEVRSAELDALEIRREHAVAQARAERRMAVPLTVGVGTKRMREAGVSDSLMTFEVGVPLPVFDRNQAASVRANAEAERADARYQRTLLLTRSRRGAALAEARLLSESARTLLDSAVPEAARLTRIARASFAEGELDLVGLLDAHDAEIDVIRQALAQQSRALDALLELQLLVPLPHSTTHPTP